MLNTDFPISTAYEDQYYPVVLFVDSLYYVFWQDMRLYSPTRSTYGARVTTTGQVLDPNAKPILQDRTEKCDAGFDGTNFLIVVQDSC